METKNNFRTIEAQIFKNLRTTSLGQNLQVLIKKRVSDVSTSSSSTKPKNRDFNGPISQHDGEKKSSCVHVHAHLLCLHNLKKSLVFCCSSWCRRPGILSPLETHKQRQIFAWIKHTNNKHLQGLGRTEGPWVSVSFQLKSMGYFWNLLSITKIQRVKNF